MTTDKPETPSTNPSLSLAAAIFDMPPGVPKDSKNQHGGYVYASADQVFAKVRKHLATHGLGLWIDEISMEEMKTNKYDKKTGEKIGETLWVKAKYEIAITPNGEAPLPIVENSVPKIERVTVMAQLLSAQTLQAVRTYAVKYYLRTKLMLATGDVDFDDALERVPAPTKPTVKFDIDDKVFKIEGVFADKTDEHRELLRALLKKIPTTANLDTAAAIVAANADWIDTLPESGQKVVKDRIKAIKAKAEPKDETAK